MTRTQANSRKTLSTMTHERWLLVIFLGGLLLRILNLGGKSLWLDEAFAAVNALREVVAVPLEAIENSHPPLYYTLLHYWIPLAGDGEFALRLPSVLISLGSLGLFYHLGRLLLDRRVALLATALLAVSPLDVWYAQEARMYIFVTFFGLLLAVGLAWEHWLGVIPIFLGFGVGLYMDYLMIPLWAGLSAVWIVFWWKRGHRVLPFAGWLLGSIGGWFLYYPFWEIVGRLLEQSLSHIFIFAQLRQLLNLPQLTTVHFLAVLLVNVVVITIGSFLLLALLQRPRLRLIITLVALAGFLTVSLSMLVPRLYSVKRVLVTGWPFVVLFVTWLVSQLRARKALAWRVLLATTLMSTLWVVFGVPKDDWRSAVAYVAQSTDQDAVVWLDPRWNHYQYEYYQSRLATQSGSVEELSELAGTAGDIWIIAERFPGLPAPSSPSEAWLDQHWELVEAVPYYRLEVRHYRPPDA